MLDHTKNTGQLITAKKTSIQELKNPLRSFLKCFFRKYRERNSLFQERGWKKEDKKDRKRDPRVASNGHIQRGREG